METAEGAVEEKPSKTKLPSPEERLELVLLGLIREQTVETLCAQSGVSKALFYQWLRRGREGLLKALEAKKPGRRRAEEVATPEDLLKLQERVSRLEKELASERKEKDRYKLQSEVGQRIIQRNGWNPEPPKKRGRPKKNGAPMMKREGDTAVNGKSSAGSEPKAARMPEPGESAGAPTGAGSEARPPQNGLA